MKLRRLIGAGILFAPTRPSLKFDFSAGDVLDSRITFTRASSATRFNSAGTLVTMTTDQPRFDYDPVTLAAKGLLIEEARTNLCLQSETLQTTWSPAASSVSINATVAPDGATTGDKLVEDGATSTHALQQFLTFSNATAYTMTGYFKAAERSWCWMFLPAAAFTATSGAYFNLGAGTVGSTISTGVTATIQAIGNSWYRCSITKTSTAAASGNTGFGIATADNVNSYAGDGASGISAWGMQLEAGAFPTSYIATTTAAATRAADVATITTLTPWFNATEGTVAAEFSASANASTVYLAFSDGSQTSNSLYFDNDSGNIRNVVFSATAAQAAMNTGAVGTVGTFNKLAAAYRANDFASSRNGGTAVTDSAGSVPVGMTGLRIGSSPSGLAVTFISGWIKRLTYYPRRLSDTQLQSLTA